jgi:hypothetical protein
MIDLARCIFYWVAIPAGTHPALDRGENEVKMRLVTFLT